MADHGSVEGRVAVVTGASRGIGASIAKRLAAAGATVVATARTLDPDPRYEGSLSQTIEEIREAGGSAVPLQADLAQSEDRQRMVAEATEQVGPIDILVNNAAAGFMIPFVEFPEKRRRLMFEVGVHAPYELAQLVVPGMIERGEGWILNISSRAADHPEGPPFPDLHVFPWSVYGMVKAALDRFTTALAAELSPNGIAVNSLSPWDNVATAGAHQTDLVDGFPLEDVAIISEAALALCSGDPAVLTGRIAHSQQLVAELGLQPQIG